VEETGAFVAATFIMKPGRQLLEQLYQDGLPILAQTVRLYCRYGPLLPLLDLLQQLPRIVLRTTTKLLDQEDCYGILLLEKIRVCNFRGY